MASNPATTAFVWIWLPGTTEPVVAGRLDQLPNSDTITFTYGRRYLDRSDAIAIYLPDLPLETGAQTAAAGSVPRPMVDAGPDAWGRRVIENRYAGGGSPTADLGFLTLLLESGSDRVGALDFQLSAESYVHCRPRSTRRCFTAAASAVPAPRPASSTGAGTSSPSSPPAPTRTPSSRPSTSRWSSPPAPG